MRALIWAFTAGAAFVHGVNGLLAPGLWSWWVYASALPLSAFLFLMARDDLRKQPSQ